MDTDRHPALRARARVGAVILGAMLLAGCAIRAETPPPEAPTPGPLEVVRQDAALASADLAEIAGVAAAETLDERRFAALERIRLDAEAHVEALGGVYSVEEGGVLEDDPLEEDEIVDDETSEDGTVDDEPVNPADLVVALTTQAAAARSAADRVDDAGLARLLVVVATARLLAADSLARNIDADRPQLDEGRPPASLPTGPTISDVAAIVVAEDQAAFALELVAARSADRVRDRARSTAQRHRATSDAWAKLAGLDDPGLDPRSVSYALDGALDTEESRAELAARVERALVTGYASLVARSEPGHRAALAVLHTLASVSARRWGHPPGALPGLE